MKVLIDNYNLTTHEYKEYHQELVDITLEELIDLFNKVPPKDKYLSNPVNIITKDFIFRKITNENVRIVPNITGLKDFPQLGDPFLEDKRFGHKLIEFKISDNRLKAYISQGTNIKTTRRTLFRNLFLNSFLPVINIIIIIFNIKRIIINIGTMFSFGVLLFLSFFSLFRTIRLAYMKPVQFRELKYEILSLNKLKPIDISHLAISFSQCFYFFIFILYFGNEIIIWVILSFTSWILIQRMLIYPLLFLSLYWRAKLAKEMIEQDILEKYNSGDIKEKSYYLNLYSLVKSEKLTKMGLISKLITGITFLFTFIPILIL